MNNDNENWYHGYSTGNPNNKLRTDGSGPLFRWLVLALICLSLLIVIVFASTIFYLLANHQSESSLPQSPTPTIQPFTAPADTPTATIVPTDTPIVTTPTPTASSSSTTLTKNLRLTCISGCDNHVDVTLDFIVIDRNASTMEWHFTIKNISPNAQSMYAYPLYLEDPSGKQIVADKPGTFTETNPINSGQTLHEYASFLFLPTSGVNYTLHSGMNISGGVEYFQTEVFTF